MRALARATVVATVVASGLACMLPALAEDLHGDRRERGRALAGRLCAECHLVGWQPQAGGLVGPSFVGIANMPSTTGTALNVFLQSHHERMPSIRLDRDEAEAVIDYILSLKRAPP